MSDSPHKSGNIVHYCLIYTSRMTNLYLISCFIAHSGVLHDLRISWRMSCKKHELLILREHLDWHPVFGRVCVARLFTFQCYVVFLFVCFVFVLYCLSSSCGLCAQCCLCLWIVPSWLSLLDCSFLIVPSWLSLLDCPFLIVPS